MPEGRVRLADPLGPFEGKTLCGVDEGLPEHGLSFGRQSPNGDGGYSPTRDEALADFKACWLS